MLADAEVYGATGVCVGLEVASLLDVGVVRGAEVCRAADEREQVRRECVDDFAARLARRHRLRAVERGQVRLPVRWQLAAHRLAPGATEFRVARLVVRDQSIPVFL